MLNGGKFPGNLFNGINTDIPPHSRNGRQVVVNIVIPEQADFFAVEYRGIDSPIGHVQNPVVIQPGPVVDPLFHTEGQQLPPDILAE